MASQAQFPNISQELHGWSPRTVPCHHRDVLVRRTANVVSHTGVCFGVGSPLGSCWDLLSPAETTVVLSCSFAVNSPSGLCLRLQ